MDTQNRSQRDRFPAVVASAPVNIGLISTLAGVTTWSFGVESFVLSVIAVGAVIAIVALATARERYLGRRRPPRRPTSGWVLLIAIVTLLIVATTASIVMTAAGRPEYSPALGVFVFVVVLVGLLLDERTTARATS